MLNTFIKLTKESCVPGALIRHNKWFVYIVLHHANDDKITFYDRRTNIFKHYLNFESWKLLC